MPTKLSPRDRPACRRTALNSGLKLRFIADFVTARDALDETEQYLKNAGAAPCLQSSVQIVIAEVLANIVRHGYCGKSGDVWLDVRHCSGTVAVRVTDLGVPFDPAVLGHCAPEPAALPEGGYGWFMIRQLCSKINYSRDDCRNHLILQVPHMPDGPDLVSGAGHRD